MQSPYANGQSWVFQMPWAGLPQGSSSIFRLPLRSWMVLSRQILNKHGMNEWISEWTCYLI